MWFYHNVVVHDQQSLAYSLCLCIKTMIHLQRRELKATEWVYIQMENPKTIVKLITEQYFRPSEILVDAWSSFPCCHVYVCSRPTPLSPPLTSTLSLGNVFLTPLVTISLCEWEDCPNSKPHASSLIFCCNWKSYLKLLQFIYLH